MKTDSENRGKTLPKAVTALYEWLDNILFALFVVMLLLIFVFKTYTVEGVSMEPNFHTGDYVFAYNFLYTPKPGDVVVLDNSTNYGQPLIKSVVAVGGQTLDIDENGTITVDGDVFAFEGASARNLGGNTAFPLVVPEDRIFVMGDNRDHSLDSRYSSLGFIDVRSVVGKVLFTIG